MLPGPILLYRCTACDGLFSRRTLSSGNTLGAQYRSDGQMKARMLPQTPPLVVCPHCHEMFCMAGAQPAISYRNYFPGFGFVEKPTPEALASKKAQEALVEQYRDVPGYKLATLAQCLQYVQSQEMFDNEKQLRLYAWHRVNDERMESGDRELLADERTNLLELLQLLPPESDPEIFLRVEALRELGCFDEADQVLDHKFSEGFTSRAVQLKQAIARKDNHPFFYQATTGFGLT